MHPIAASPHPFPDDDTLGLPNWCPRGETPWPDHEGYHWHRARLLVVRSWSLTAHGRRVVASRQQAILGGNCRELDQHKQDEILAYANLRLEPRPAETPEGASPPVSLPWLLQQFRNGRARDYRLRQILDAIDTVDPTTASDLLLPVIIDWAHVVDGTRAADLLTRASLIRRLPWTTSTPPTSWHAALDGFLRAPDVSHPCVHLPPTLFPRTIRLHWAEMDWNNPRAVDLLYYPGSGIEDIEVLLLRDLGGDSLHRLISHIRHRHDLPVLAPDLLPLLLGHRKPEYAAFGLELMAQLTAGGPRVMSHTR